MASQNIRILLISGPIKSRKAFPENTEQILKELVCTGQTEGHSLEPFITCFLGCRDRFPYGKAVQ